MTATTILAAGGPTGLLNNEHDFRVVNNFARHTGWLHGIVAGYAGYGIALFALLLVVGWWLARRSGNPATMGLALCAGIGTLVAVAINQPIVRSVHEARPYTTLPHTLVLVQRSMDPGFPSDHATAAGAAAVGLFFVSRRLGWTAAAAALLMAFARVYAGAHYPRDVLAGLALGAVVAVLGALFLAPLLARVIERAQQTPLRPLLAARPAGAAEPTAIVRAGSSR